MVKKLFLKPVLNDLIAGNSEVPNRNLISEIKREFELLTQAENRDVERLTISLVRSIKRLQIKDRQLSIRFQNIISDIQSMIINEKSYLQLKNKQSRNIEYDDSFFKSLRILGEELFQLLDQL